MMAAGITASLDATGALNVVGSDGDDQFLFRKIGKQISIEGVDGSWSSSSVKSIVIDLEGGDDFVSLHSLENGGTKKLKEKVTMHSGDGDEHILLASNHDVYFGGLGHTLYVAPGAPPKLNGATLNLSNSVVGSLKSGVLTVTGTNGNDSISFKQSSGKISILGVSGSWSVSKVTSIVVNLQDGNDNVSLDSLANGGNQLLKPAVTVNSGNGDEFARLANGNDVSFSGLGHTLHVAADGTATLDGEVLTWNDPDPNPTPDPDPTPPPTESWFDTYIQDAALRSLGNTLYTDGLIDRADIMAIFQSAQDAGSVDVTEFGDLQRIVGNATLFGTLDYVWKLSSYIVSGNTANANYQGQTLGNLAAGSSDTHLGKLVNKWFVGLDRPSTSYGYTLASGTLFVNGASYSDIDQGNLANCSFMAGLAETALRSQSTIDSMFVVNGDGTYTVRYYRSGVAQYVTVDSYLPTSGSGNYVYALGGKSASNAANELWVALAEKAYAQFFETVGYVNAYSSIAYQYAFTTMEHITGQATVGVTDTSGSNSLSTFATAWNAGKLICLITYASPPTSGIVGNHAYAVVGYDSTTQSVTLFNPWGINHGLKTLTWSEVQANFSYFDRTA